MHIQFINTDQYKNNKIMRVTISFSFDFDG